MNKSDKATKKNNLPSGWRVVALGDVGKIITGKTPLTKKVENFGKDYMFITPRDMNNQKYIRHTERKLSKIGFNSIVKNTIPKNSISISCIGSDMGKVLITTKECATNQQINSLIIKEELSEYIYYCLSTKQDEIKNYASGSAVPIMNKTAFSQLKIILPPLPEQKAIAHILGKLDEKIELNRQINQTLETMAQTLFKSWFVDFDPVIDNALKAGNKIPKPLQHKANKRKTTKSTLPKDTQALFPDNFVFNDKLKKWIPEGWEVENLGEAVEIKRGKNITKSNFISGTIPVIAGGIKPAGFHNKSNAKQPVITISSSGANAGFIKLNLIDVWASDCSFISKDFEDNVYYFYHWLNLRQKQIFDMQTGSAQPHIYPKDLNRLQIIIPSENIVQTFESVGSTYYKRNSLMNNEIQTLVKLRDTLLPKLILGKIRL